MVELTDLPETLRQGDPPERALVPGRARRHPVPLALVARSAVGLQPGPARAPRRQQGGRVAHRRPGLSRHGLPRLVPGLHYASYQSLLFYLATGAPTLSLLLTIWVGGIMTQALIEDLRPYLPRPVDLAPQEPEGEVLRHLPLPDLLAAGDARRLARALGAGRTRPLRARPRPTVPVPSPLWGEGQGEGVWILLEWNSLCFQGEGRVRGHWFFLLPTSPSPLWGEGQGEGRLTPRRPSVKLTTSPRGGAAR